MPGSWQPLNNQPTFNVDAMLLLTDGSIMCHEYLTPNWHKLVPDKNSDYANGTWRAMAPMPDNAPLLQNGPVNAPLYFASAVLRDGTVFCAGGEDNGAFNQVELLTAELYDPATDVWTPIATPTGWSNIGDASSCVLPDGRVLLGNDNGNSLPQATAIWDPESGTWSAGGDSLDLNSEEGWTLLPDGTVLAVQCTDVPNAQKYVVATNQWVSAGTPLQLLPAEPEVAIGGTIYEMGPQVLMPDGNVFASGAGGLTGIYTPPATVPTDPGSWANGPDFPADKNGAGTLLGAVDAPACLLPNGNVLCVVGTVQLATDPEPGQTFSAQFFEFDGAALNPVPGTASASNAYTYNCRLLVLPTGQVLLSTSTSDLEIYTPSGGPLPAWRPHITHVPRRLHPGRVYRLHGRQLNGLSQACAYGDDQQMATNYPLIRLRGRPGVGDVFCRTFDHSTMAVATGAAIHHTHFHVPHDLPHGEYRLEVIANGIASRPVEVHVGRHRHDDDDHHHDHDHDHDEEIVEVEQDEAKYKDKDAKEAKEKEKDVKEAKEKDAKELKEKDVKEFKEKDGKEAEHKGCKEKEHKEFEHKGCKEKDHKEHKEKEHAEHAYQAPRQESGEYGELLHKIGQIAERLERIEDNAQRRPFIRREERPDVGARPVRGHDEETSRDDDDQGHHDDDHRRDEHYGDRGRDEGSETPPRMAPRKEPGQKGRRR